MANEFFVEPANVFTALKSGVSGFDSAQRRGKEQALMAGRQSAAQKAAAGDHRGAIAELMGLGDADGMKAIAQFAHHQATEQQARASQAQSAEHFRLSHGLQQQQFGLSRERLADERANRPFEPTPEGGMRFKPGGPADPSYLASKTPPDPTANMEPEQKLRKEFEGNAKPHLEVRRGYERVLASKDDAAGDISLIFGFMKMLDPGSVVREGEFATAQNAAGIPDQIKNAYNRALSGERLNPKSANAIQGTGEGALRQLGARVWCAREAIPRDCQSVWARSIQGDS